MIQGGQGLFASHPVYHLVAATASEHVAFIITGQARGKLYLTGREVAQVHNTSHMIPPDPSLILSLQAICVWVTVCA